MKFLTRLFFGLFIAANSLVLQAAEPAALHVYVFLEGKPLPGVVLKHQQQRMAVTDENGAVHIDIDEGSYEFDLVHDGQSLKILPMQLGQGTSTQLILAIPKKGAEPDVDIESSQASVHSEGEGGLDVGEPDATISGYVYSLEGNKPIQEVKVFISGLRQDIRTDSDGRFSVSVPAGQYSISVVHPEYSTQTLTSLALEKGKVFEATMELTPSGLQLDEITVTAPYLDGGALALADEKRNTSNVAEVIGADQISNSGDSNAASALKRVTGLTLVDGKFIYVRGLGERYSNITFNGSSLPSPDPTRRVVPLDVFPASVLGSVLVQKTYSPDLPGDFAGGAIVLRTKAVPEDRVKKFELSVGGNSLSTFQEGTGYEGGGMDLFGVDDGTRDFPAAASAVTNGTDTPTWELNDEQVQRLGRAFPVSYKTEKQTLLPDIGFKFNFADRYERFASDSAWGYNVSLGYKRTSRFREEDRLSYNMASGGALIEANTLARDKTETDIDINSMLSLVYEQGSGTVLESTSLLSRKSSDTVVIDDLYASENDLYFKNTDLEWVERQLFTQQFRGEHRLYDFYDLKVNWQATYALATREEPDHRYYQYELIDGAYVMPEAGNTNARQYSSLSDELFDLGLDLEWPVYGLSSGVTMFKAGASVADKTRDSESDRYRFESRWRSSPGALSQSILSETNPETIFATDNIRPDGWVAKTATLPTDKYSAKQRISSTYLMADLGFEKTKLMVGARLEKFEQSLSTLALDGSVDNHGAPALSESNVLPAISVTWRASESTQYRIGYSQTVNRPDFKERSPSPYIDPVTRDPFMGNPDLVVASISNFDFRWEHYVTKFESYSAALFYKELTNPIEIEARTGASTIYTFVNSPQAYNTGIEMQGRFWLSRLFGRSLSRFYLDSNVSLINSEVELGDRNGNSPLQGQAPWVVNVTLAYENLITSSKASLLLNVNGDTLVGRGAGSEPDEYLESVPLLDFLYSYDFPFFDEREDDLSMKFSVKNILDSTYRTSYESGELRKSYNKGVSMSLGFKYKWI